MPAPQTDLLQGTLDLLILKALALQDLHGMGVSRRIAQMTGGAFDVKAGSLFPALHRMEQAGWLASFWGESETNRRAKFYVVDQGRQKATAHRIGAVGANIPCHGDSLAHHIGGFVISRLRALWNNVFRRKQLDRDLDEELQAYVELVSAEKVQSGRWPGRGAS